jgi:hypothetical protein
LFLESASSFSNFPLYEMKAADKNAAGSELPQGSP